MIPASLARMGTLGIKGDAVKARDYYAKALAAGMGAAAQRRMAALSSALAFLKAKNKQACKACLSRLFHQQRWRRAGSLTL